MNTGVPVGSTDQNSTAVEISTRIRILAGQGLKPRDISSLLHVHPLIVVRVLAGTDVDSAMNGNAISKLDLDSNDRNGERLQVICDS